MKKEELARRMRQVQAMRRKCIQPRRLKIWLPTGECLEFMANEIIEQDGVLSAYKVVPAANPELSSRFTYKVLVRSRDWLSYSIEEIDGEMDES